MDSTEAQTESHEATESPADPPEVDIYHPGAAYGRPNRVTPESERGAEKTEEQPQPSDDYVGPKTPEELDKAFVAHRKKVQKLREREGRNDEREERIRAFEEKQERLAEAALAGDPDAIFEQRMGMTHEQWIKKKLQAKKAPGILPPEVEEELEESRKMRERIERYEEEQAERQRTAKEQAEFEDMAGKLSSYLANRVEDPGLRKLAAAKDFGFGHAVLQKLQSDYYDPDLDDWTRSPVEVAREVEKELREYYTRFRSQWDQLFGEQGTQTPETARRSTKAEFERGDETSRARDGARRSVNLPLDSAAEAGEGNPKEFDLQSWLRRHSAKIERSLSSED